MDNAKTATSGRPYTAMNIFSGTYRQKGDPVAEIRAARQAQRSGAFGNVLSLKEAAALLQCHPKTLRRMALANKVPARRVGKLWRFSEQRLKEWLEAS